MNEQTFSVFEGFLPGKTQLIRLPSAFVTELLPLIDDLDELKLALFCFWAMEQRDGRFRYLRHDNFDVPELPAPLDDPDRLALALARAIKRGLLLTAVVDGAAGPETIYFLNTQKGRAAVEMLAAGRWQPGDADYPVELLPEQPSIFRLYEENIGLLTPMIADALRDAAQTYPSFWIEDAIHIAVTRNARNWRYVCAILERWEKEGKDDGSRTGPGINGRHSAADPDRFTSGKYADIIES